MRTKNKLIHALGLTLLLFTLFGCHDNISDNTSNCDIATQSSGVFFVCSKQAADREISRDQYNLGILYYTGNVVKQDYQQAYQWFLKAANQGDAKAQYNLGVMYDRGHGVLSAGLSMVLKSC